ncbi:putative protein [Aquifex aeolicus VF5]|uniref:Uncharacterized protein aq_1287 n=1 Tax=Aquifex aeolicus (strain VF5) TaxID=224324 RepID=Y1287_AQUAE|nr:RecName: Full=Uncharacterized protein aq_1287 [Aquifex aeolicus VF5]AAC07280.1 putative protein [Aquifex aeolicus VF5]
MKKKTGGMRIFKVFGLFLFSLIFFGLLSLATFPKFLLFDRLLIQNKIFLIAQKVKENSMSIELFKGKVYFQNREALEFDYTKLSLGFLSVNGKILCRGKISEISYSFLGSIETKFRDFSCTPFVKKVNGRIELSDGIYGRVKLEGFKTELALLDEINLNFKGQTFTGSVKYLGMELKGQGRITLNRKNFLMSKVDGEFKGNGVRIKVQGTLNNLRVYMK